MGKLAWPCWREIAAQKIWPVPEAVVTVLCTPDDGCGWHPNHVEWTCKIINRLLCVASRWTIINTAYHIYSRRRSLETTLRSSSKINVILEKGAHRYDYITKVIDKATGEAVWQSSLDISRKGNRNIRNSNIKFILSFKIKWVIEEKIKGVIEVTRRRGRRRTGWP